VRQLRPGRCRARQPRGAGGAHGGLGRRLGGERKTALRQAQQVPDPRRDLLMAGMLAGIKVVSFTHFLQGPSASQLLADLGADVVKVEPRGGAFERSWTGPDKFVEGYSPFFALGNRNVRSIVRSEEHTSELQSRENLVCRL